MQPAWALSVYQGAAEQDSLTECLEHLAPHEFEALHSLHWVFPIIVRNVALITFISTTL